MQFFGKFIGWVLLGVVTVGIYLFFLPVKSKKWKTKHAYIKALGSTAQQFEKRELTLEEKQLRFAKRVYRMTLFSPILIILAILIIVFITLLLG